MKEYDVVISTKGQVVLPKEIREQFKLSTGSKIKVWIDGEQIILKPRSVMDEMKDLIIADLARDGKPVTEKTVKEYQAKLGKALDAVVAEAEQEYQAKQYITLSDLRREEEGNV